MSTVPFAEMTGAQAERGQPGGVHPFHELTLDVLVHEDKLFYDTLASW